MRANSLKRVAQHRQSKRASGRARVAHKQAGVLSRAKLPCIVVVVVVALASLLLSRSRVGRRSRRKVLSAFLMIPCVQQQRQRQQQQRRRRRRWDAVASWVTSLARSRTFDSVLLILSNACERRRRRRIKLNRRAAFRPTMAKVHDFSHAKRRAKSPAKSRRCRRKAAGSQERPAEASEMKYCRWPTQLPGRRAVLPFRQLDGLATKNYAHNTSAKQLDQSGLSSAKSISIVVVVVS